MSVLPTLPPDAVQHSTLLVLRATTLIHTSVDPAEQQQRQQDLAQLVNSSEAWGLIIPFLEHEDMNVQFYGAHIAGVKTVRDWASISSDLRLPLRDTILNLTARAIALGRAKMVLRRLYVAVTAIALKLTLSSPPEWPDFLTYSLSTLQSQGADRETLFEFMTIAVEEVQRAPKAPNHQIHHAMNAAIPAFMETFSSTVTSPVISESERTAALKCLQAWIVWGLPGNDLTSIIPTLISLLSSQSTFIPASDALQEILTSSVLADGGGIKTLTEPLLDWITAVGRGIAEGASAAGSPNPISNSLCKLIVALGDQSNQYIAKKLVNPQNSSVPLTLDGTVTAEGIDQRVEIFLRTMLVYTGFPGWYGIDEEESEMTLGFWYILQESLWDVGGGSSEDGDDEWAKAINTESGRALDEALKEMGSDGLRSFDGGMVEDEETMTPIAANGVEHGMKKDDGMSVARAVFSEVVKVLKRKVTWPTPAQMQESGLWDAAQREAFGSYRHNVGDTLVNACYVLRDQFLENSFSEMRVQLAQAQGSGQEAHHWEDIEATLFCVKSVHEALTASNLGPLGYLFEELTLAALPQTGSHRVRWTLLTLIGEYANYFSSTDSSAPLLRAVNYTVNALPEPSLSLQASITLRELCDANRSRLAPHLNSFADLHRNIELLGSEEKSKVLESISSVISAMPPFQAIEPITAIVQPLLGHLERSLLQQSSEEAQAQCINQLRSLTGAARGLTVIADPLEEIFVPDRDAISQARLDPRMEELRNNVVIAVEAIANRWWNDMEIIGYLSDLVKAITATSAEESVLSLPPQPLLRIVASANARQVTSTWLTLGTILVAQLYPSQTLETLVPVPSQEVVDFIAELIPQIIGPCLHLLSTSDTMEATLSRNFFKFCETVATNFLTTIYRLPSTLLTSLVLHAISALSLQERYSLVGSCKFLFALMRGTFTSGELTTEADALVELHGRSIIAAVIYGVAGTSPRSAMQNLSEVLHCLASRRTTQTRAYLNEILFSPDFVTKYPMATQKVKEQFIYSLMAARSGNKARLAVTNFQNVTRGLEGALAGYATV